MGERVSEERLRELVTFGESVEQAPSLGRVDLGLAGVTAREVGALALDLRSARARVAALEGEVQETILSARAAVEDAELHERAAKRELDTFRDLLARVHRSGLLGEAAPELRVAAEEALGVPRVGRFGDPGIRDPESPCDDFDPGETVAFPQCYGDGHYMCKECRHLVPEEPEESEEAP
jgi:hypothetical protein